ncbi:MAG: hypothetical protein JM58_09175 [Peptococcaceae bacterium BICA1-8]|nr:MAG: hypothetical protein JM58_09175 [Peptococcaceae bacterium BICA1-8]
MDEPRVLITGCLVQKGKQWTTFVGKQIINGRLHIILKDFQGEEIMVPASDVNWQDDRFNCQPQDTTENMAM